MSKQQYSILNQKMTKSITDLPLQYSLESCAKYYLFKKILNWNHPESSRCQNCRRWSVPVVKKIRPIDSCHTSNWFEIQAKHVYNSCNTKMIQININNRHQYHKTRRSLLGKTNTKNT